MTTVPDIPVVQLPAHGEDHGSSGTPASMWSVDVPQPRRPSPLVLAALGVVAGIAAMALGTAAVISAARSTDAASDDGAGAVSTRPPTPATSAAERRVLSLLAKPSTERVAFTGSTELVLAVGSGGRAAILLRGLAPAEATTPYAAWIVVPGRAPIRAVEFIGTERAVFLARRLGPRASVVVSKTKPVGGLSRNRVVAVRG